MLRKTLGRQDRHLMGGIYGRDQTNHSSNAIVNKRPKDQTWHSLRQLQKAVVLAKERKETISALSCAEKPEEWANKRQLS